MKKYTLLICVILIIFATIGAFFGGFFHQKNLQIYTTEAEELHLQDTPSKEEILQNDIRNYNRAMHYANSRACEEIVDENQKQECFDYSIILTASQDPSKANCENISHEWRQKNCKNISFEKTAFDNENKNLCNAISEEIIQKRCRENIDAIKFSKIAKNHTSSIQECEELEWNFKQECHKLVKDYKSEELYLMALQTKNTALCSSIEIPNIANKCRDEILFSRAEQENNIALCENILNNASKQDCILKNQASHDARLLNQATKEQNLALCQTITNTQIKNNCHDIITLSIVRKTKNINLCQTLKSRENIEICQKIENL